MAEIQIQFINNGGEANNICIINFDFNFYAFLRVYRKLKLNLCK